MYKIVGWLKSLSISNIFDITPAIQKFLANNEVLLGEEKFLSALSNELVKITEDINGNLKLGKLCDKPEEDLRKRFDNNKKDLQSKLAQLAVEVTVYIHIHGQTNATYILESILSALKRASTKPCYYPKILCNAELFNQLYTINGQCYPFNQCLNPLLWCTDSIGECAGYVHNWAKNISIDDLSIFDFNNNIQQLQKTHASPSIFASSKTFNTINELLDNIDINHVYKVSSSDRASLSSHAMGIRLLSDERLEFFDPNFGLFTFNRKHDFCLWFACLRIGYLSRSSQFRFKHFTLGRLELSELKNIDNQAEVSVLGEEFLSSAESAPSGDIISLIFSSARQIMSDAYMQRMFCDNDENVLQILKKLNPVVQELAQFVKFDRSYHSSIEKQLIEFDSKYTPSGNLALLPVFEDALSIDEPCLIM